MPEPKLKPKHCWNCGQPVEDKKAEKAATIGVAFCCECGLELEKGECENNACRFFQLKPEC